MTVSTKHKERMYALLAIIQKWSDCPEGRQHACLIAIKGKYVVGTGYNGSFTPCAFADKCFELPKETMLDVCRATHAEVNACYNLFMDFKHREDVVAFVTKRPCVACLKALREHNIRHVYWREMKDWHVVSEGDLAL